MKLVIMGAPSSGKGVQAKLIQNNFGLQHISTGQILRDFVKENAEKNKKISETINKGDFIKDSIMCKIVADALSKVENDYILDGFPRTKKQTKYLLEHFCPDMVIYLQTDKEVALDRVTSRVVCPVCKKSYNKKDLQNLVCPNDKAILEVRQDDNIETYLKRYQTFEKQTKPILEMFKKVGVLEIVDNNKTVEETFSSIANLLSPKKEIK